VPIAGFAIGGWNSATALVVYWVENVIGSLLIALRILLHQRLTHKQGHYRVQLNTTTTTRNGKARSVSYRKANTTFLVEFLVTSILFTAAHGLFLGILLGVMQAPIDSNAVLGGVGLVAAFQLISFVIDVMSIKTRPFAWIKQVSQFALGRVVLVHLAIIAGVFLAVFLSNNAAFVVPFAALKLLSDLSNGVSMGVKGERAAPAWLIRVMDTIKPGKKPGEDFATYLVTERERGRAEAALDEQVRK